MRKLLPSARGLVAGAVVSLLTVALAVVVSSPAAADAPPPGVSPVMQRPSGAVTADALPTVQIDNGVVWSQAVVGNTVYAGGQFTNVRPAGAAAGTNLTPRGNLVAFDIRTGLLNTSFAPSLNGTIKAVTASPDGSRIYVGGSFTSANGSNRYRIAAYSTSTGQLISSFAPSIDATVTAITVTSGAVYAAGSFSVANGVARSHLAAFDPGNGALLGWAPSADATVQALVATPDGSRIILGGQFQNVNGSPAIGLAAVDAVNGTMYPWAANQVVKDGGDSAAILSLTTDGNAVYSTSYVYGADGTFEGVLSAEPDSGAINWLADCHGDTYSTYAANGAVYVASHQHFCSNIGGFPDTNPRTVWHHATAFTTQATGTVQTNTQSGGGYGNFAGQPSPSLINWFPDFTVGTFTGQSQATWSITGNSQYVVYGGEFPKVNNVAQSGLVRFAVPSIAPKKEGPRLSGASVPESVIARSSSSVRFSWQTNWDRDDQDLTYEVQRDGAIIYTTQATSQWWNMPTIGMIDTGLTPGTTYNYRVRVTDPDGNRAYSNYQAVTLPTGDAPPDSAFATDVLTAGASDYWRLDQAAGATTNYDYAGFSDLTVSSGVTGGVTGAIGGDANTASNFNGTSSGFASTASAIPGPNTFTVSAWFATTSRNGGKIIGFGNAKTGNSTSYDRHIYMDKTGHLYFGVYSGATVTVKSAGSYNDGAYHQVVASLSTAGLALYVDGALVGTNAGATSGQPFSGYWRVGGDSVGSWPGAGNAYLNGWIDEVAVYPTALSLAQVRKQYVDSGRTKPGFTAPSDSYGATIWNDAPYLYYRMDETSGSTATDVSGNGVNGTYTSGTTKGVSSPVSGATGTAVTFNGSTATLASSQQIAGPSVYSEEIWFKTTSTAGGKLIGFGDKTSGNSASYDRHIYMLPSGQLSFGTYTGATNVATSPASYNNGAWHQAVATQGADGMTLYVDGQSVATDPQTQAQSYSGYWRIGGDNLGGWPSVGSGYFAGTLDEAAVYMTELSAATVLAHYRASGAAVQHAPTASFTTALNGSQVSVDGTGSADSDGTITNYAWDFGDGATASGATASHTYTAAGDYMIRLTVTDDTNLTGSTTHTVSVTIPNQPPTAAFTSTPTNLSVAFDGGASSDPDGTIASYAWDFGDNATGTGATPSHVYSVSGTYSVTLTVTDDKGAQASVSHDVSVLAANVLPTAAFTASTNAATVSIDASGSSDPDGTIASYAWDFGDGHTGTGVTAQHVYAAQGDYTITLTVTDDRGGKDTATHTVTITIPNQKPTATFATQVSGAGVSVDASGSSDPDGTIASYAWDFGDGSTATGKTANHTYQTGGSYTITLTVTDDRGATDTADVTVTVSNIVGADAFGRSLAKGWGSADVGGAWSVSGGSSYFSVSGGSGQMTVPSTSLSPFAMLNSVSAENVDYSIDVSLTKAPTGTGTYAVLFARQIDNSGYRLKVRFLADGTVHLAWVKVLAGKNAVVSEMVVKNLTYTVGDTLRVRFTVTSNTDGTTSLAGTVWPAGTTEPATPQLRATDTEASLRAPGAIGIQSVLGSSTTNAPATLTYDNVSVLQQ